MNTIRRIRLIATAVAFAVACSQPKAASPPSPAVQFIDRLLDENNQLQGIPFGEVIFDATGQRVLPVDRKNEVDKRVVKQISAALNEVVKSSETDECAGQPGVKCATHQ